LIYICFDVGLALLNETLIFYFLYCGFAKNNIAFSQILESKKALSPQISGPGPKVYTFSH
jgi:hypothetical protein